jgi:hypothetical protein
MGGGGTLIAEKEVREVSRIRVPGQGRGREGGSVGSRRLHRCCVHDNTLIRLQNGNSGTSHNSAYYSLPVSMLSHKIFGMNSADNINTICSDEFFSEALHFSQEQRSISVCISCNR